MPSKFDYRRSAGLGVAHTRDAQNRKSRRAGIVIAIASFASTATPQQLIELHVSAVVPPRLCEFPQHCTVSRPEFGTSVRVVNGKVYFQGSRPAVSQDGDVLTILF